MAQTDPKIKLNEALDGAALAQQFKPTRRIQVFNFLTPESARHVSGLLENTREWKFAYNEGDQAREVSADEIAALTQQQQTQLWQRVLNRASTGFQYLYRHYAIAEYIDQGFNPGHPLHSLKDFVDSEVFLSLLKTITGFDVDCYSDVYATCYGRGHFLLDHNDKAEAAAGRLAAWVLNMTPEWRADWGGHLLFYDDKGNVQQGFIPSYNTLNMFAVPQSHGVAYVPPFAGAERLSVMGWLRTS